MMRQFPKHIEAIAKSAFDTVVSDEPWTILGDPTPTASAAVLVEMKSTGARAYAKPANPASHFPTVCAAHEKVVSDLAYVLGLPIPPVVLSRPPSNLDFPSIVAVSYVPFPQCRRWSERLGIAEFAPANITQIASAMAVFHTFICDTDHGGNDGNQVIDMYFEDRYVHGIAFIDYAYSLTHTWDWNQVPPSPNRSFGRCNVFDQSIAGLDEAAIAEAVELIEGLPDETVRKLVNRIPDDSYSSTVAETLCEFLCERKANLRRLMAL
jgi:hypothetical protein